MLQSGFGAPSLSYLLYCVNLVKCMIRIKQMNVRWTFSRVYALHRAFSSLIDSLTAQAQPRAEATGDCVLSPIVGG
jgi:hypothetical protein